MNKMKVGKVVNFGLQNIQKYKLFDEEMFDDACIPEHFFTRTTKIFGEFELSCNEYESKILIEVETPFSLN